MTEGCARWRDDLAAYVLGALDDEDCAAMKLHLAACPACRAGYQELVPVRDWLTRTRRHLADCRECRAYYADLVYPPVTRQVPTGRETPPVKHPTPET